MDESRLRGKGSQGRVSDPTPTDLNVLSDRRRSLGLRTAPGKAEFRHGLSSSEQHAVGRDIISEALARVCTRGRNISPDDTGPEYIGAEDAMKAPPQGAGDIAENPNDIDPADLRHAAHHFCEDDYVALLEYALLGDVYAAKQLTTQHILAGRSVDTVILDLLAPAAHMAGDYWSRDRNSFMEVALAISVLSSVLRALEVKFVCAPSTPPDADHKSCLLTSLPDDEHSFGLQAFATLLRANGWNVVMLPRASSAHVSREVARQHYSFVGLSMGSLASADAVKDWSKAVRANADDSDLPLMLGGLGSRRFADCYQNLDIDYLPLTSVDALALAKKCALRGAPLTR